MTKLTARERLLNSAAELFYSDGLAATGIDAITAHAGVAKMSLYNNFSSKADLVEAYLERRIGEWHGFYQTRLERAQTPQQRVLAVFDSYIDHAALSYEWGFRGCGLLNAAAELAVDDPARVSVLRQKEEAEALFAAHLGEMPLAAQTTADDVARHLSFLLEGAMSRAGLDGHDAALKAARKIAVCILEKL